MDGRHRVAGPPGDPRLGLELGDNGVRRRSDGGSVPHRSPLSELPLDRHHLDFEGEELTGQPVVPVERGGFTLDGEDHEALPGLGEQRLAEIICPDPTVKSRVAPRSRDESNCSPSSSVPT